MVCLVLDSILYSSCTRAKPYTLVSRREMPYYNKNVNNNDNKYKYKNNMYDNTINKTKTYDNNNNRIIEKVIGLGLLGVLLHVGLHHLEDVGLRGKGRRSLCASIIYYNIT